ncbi:unnamed protein product [Lactuca virosa]|uniref:Secretory carrier-associated membrane protein n=1 Tax=Lactuca virosa TaxID=75947 RepID=A0AAU9LJD1_9ASTR|nr:unnamed protein product [Lactuca virosa]
MGSRNDPNENPTATSNPISLPAEGTTVDIPINNAKDLKAIEKELQDKEAELKRREEELKKREEAIAKSGVVIEENNWPPFYPIIHHNIKSEIPIHLQKVQYVAFGSWLGIIVCLVWNLIAVSVAWYEGEGVTIWLCAVIYIILGIPGSYFLWYRPLYRATRSDSAVKFSFFLITYSFHVFFCAFASLAPPIFIQGKSIAGILPAFNLLVGNAMLGGIYLIGFGLFFIETAISIWVIQQVYSYFRGSGKAAEMKLEKLKASRRRTKAGTCKPEKAAIMLQTCSYREVSRENLHRPYNLQAVSSPWFIWVSTSSFKFVQKPSVQPRSLDSDSEDDVDKTLNLYYGKLNPKEQTVILKEQRSWERVIRVFEWMKSQPEYSPNVIHYNVVLRALGRARKWDELRRCWIDMANKGVFPTNNTYGMLVDVYGKAGLVKEALLWIKHMKLRGIFPDEVTMNTVVRVLKDGGEYDRADRFYKEWCVGIVELNDLEFDSCSEPISLTQFLLTELFRTGGRNHTKSMITENSVQKPRLTATYNTLIDLYGKAGRLKDAGDVFAEMLQSGIAMDTITFNTMIFTCGSHGNLSEAESLLYKMEERGISPDTKTYNIFLSLYAAMGDIDEALECYRKIREVGLFPDVVTHRAVLQILCERRMIHEVENVIKDIEKSGLYIDNHSVPILIKMYVEEGLINRAKFIFEKCYKKGGLSSKTYAAIIDTYAEKGLWTEAEYVFNCERDLIDIIEYNVMIKAYGIAKLHDQAFSLFKGMKSHGIWPDECTYNSLIQMFAGGDLVNEARDLLHEMQESGFKPSCLTFSGIISSYSRLTMVNELDEIYHEMVKSGVKPNEIVFGSLINGFAETGNLEDALRYYKIMQESGFSPNQVILTSLIKAYSKTGIVEGARTIYKKMKELPGGPDVVASNSMINLYADFGMVSEAILIFDDLKKTNKADAVSFSTMIYVYKNMGMLDEAIEVVEKMKDSGLLTDCASFNKAMACYATTGRLREGGEMLREMVVTRKLLPTAGTFKVLFTVLKKGGIPAEGVEQLEAAYREGKRYSGEAVVALVFLVVGLSSLSLEFFESFEMGLDVFVYNVGIYVYGGLGRVDEALKVFMKMQDEGLGADVVTYIYLVGCYGKAGMVEGVKRVYSKLKYGEIDPNESLFKAVIEAYKVVNRHDLAELVDQEMRLTFQTESLPDSGSEDEVGEASVSLSV